MGGSFARSVATGGRPPVRTETAVTVSLVPQIVRYAGVVT